MQFHHRTFDVTHTHTHTNTVCASIKIPEAKGIGAAIHEGPTMIPTVVIVVVVAIVVTVVIVVVVSSLRIRNSNKTMPWYRCRRACSIAPNRTSVFARRFRSRCGSTFSFDTATQRSRRFARARTAAEPRVAVAVVGADNT